MLLGDILVRKGLITDMKRNEALRLKAREDIPIGVALVRLGLVTEDDIAKALADANGLEAVDPSLLEVQPGAMEAVPLPLMERYRIMPFERDRDELSVARGQAHSAGRSFETSSGRPGAAFGSTSPRRKSCWTPLPIISTRARPWMRKTPRPSRSWMSSSGGPSG